MGIKDKGVIWICDTIVKRPELLSILSFLLKKVRDLIFKFLFSLCLLYGLDMLMLDEKLTIC